MILAVGLVGVAAFVVISKVQGSEAAVKADSAALCADLASTPGVLTQQGFGFPSEGETIADKVLLMRAFEQRWTNLATIAPPTVRAEVAAVATAAGTVTSRVESSQSFNRETTLTTMQSVTAQTHIPAWTTEYCD